MPRLAQRSKVFSCARARGSGEISLGQCAFTKLERRIHDLRTGERCYKVEFKTRGKSYVVQYYNDVSSSKEAEAVLVTAPNTKSGSMPAMQSTSTPPANTTARCSRDSHHRQHPAVCAGPVDGQAGAGVQLPVAAERRPDRRSERDQLYGAERRRRRKHLLPRSPRRTARAKRARGAPRGDPRQFPVISPPPPAPKPLVTITGSKVLVSGRSATVTSSAATRPVPGRAS